MEALACVAAGRLAYISIPADVLRSSVDSVFPSLARNLAADSAAGRFHRWEAGHDLLLDVPKSFFEGGLIDGLEHAGHVVLTDFPTRMGIPIPGFSKTGMGEMLVNWGIPRGWLSINICDAGFGILAIAEGAKDLAAALAGQLPWGVGTFFDTFVEGTAEIVLALNAHPIFLLGGIENILAGIVSLWKEISVYVDPLKFLGSAFFSALFGAGFGYLLSKGMEPQARIRRIVKESAMSAVTGGCFTIESAFGYGAFLSYVAFELSGRLAVLHEKQRRALLSCSSETFLRLLSNCLSDEFDISRMLESCRPTISLLHQPPLPCTGYPLVLDTGARFSLEHFARIALDPNPRIGLDAEAKVVLGSKYGGAK